MTTDTTLQTLLDREAIRECIFSYCRGIDRADEDALRGSYWPDATDSHGPWKGSAASFIDTASGKALHTVKVGEEPEGVKVSPDGKTLYVTSEVASLVHVIDLASGKVAKNIQAGKRPRRFALTPDGAQLWVTNELDASVTVIDTKENKVIDTIKFEVKGARAADITPVGITMSRDGKRAFVGLGKANHVAEVDVATKAVKNQILVGKRAWGLGLDAAEKTLYVVNGMSDDLTIVDVAGAKALKTVKVGRVPHSVMVVE